jgi:glycosyltransferase involved in cell wall biosynthesis
MQTSQFDILCFGEDWYKASYSSSRQIALRLAAGRRLLWINPLPIRLPSLKGSRDRRAFLRKALHKLKTHLRLLSRRAPGVWVYSPVYLPSFMNEKGDRRNAALLTWQIRILLFCLGLKLPLFLATGTYQPLLVARRLRRFRFFWYYADKSSAFTDLPADRAASVRDLYERYDRAVFAEADRIYCASTAILEDLVSRMGDSGKIAYLPHGVDLAHWLPAGEGKLPVPAALEKLPHPVVGYFGSLTNHNNKAILQAILRRHPDWSVLLIGKVVGDYSELAAHPNFYLTGAVDYADLPAWAQVFDVGIMNWIETEWIASSFPVKAQEYLAMGLPVVSVRIRELQEHFGELIRIAGDDEEFVRFVEQEIAGDSDLKRRRRRESVRDRDWSKLAERILADAGAEAI